MRQLSVLFISPQVSQISRFLLNQIKLKINSWVINRELKMIKIDFGITYVIIVITSLWRKLSEYLLAHNRLHHRRHRLLLKEYQNWKIRFNLFKPPVSYRWSLWYADYETLKRCKLKFSFYQSWYKKNQNFCISFVTAKIELYLTSLCIGGANIPHFQDCFKNYWTSIPSD